jgi:hypothetical protein
MKRWTLLQILPGADRPAHPVRVAPSATPETPSIAAATTFYEDDRWHICRLDALVHAFSIGRATGPQ